MLCSFGSSSFYFMPKVTFQHLLAIQLLLFSKKNYLSSVMFLRGTSFSSPREATLPAKQ